tara:strand:+ start:24358 stop:26484 length:2127 start_codon:yes stop_codon:yes gene_type:complete
MFKDLRQETTRGILAIVFFVLGIFLVLAATENAGMVGDAVYDGLSFLVGIGYFVVPVALLFLSYTFVRPLEQDFGIARTVGLPLFFFSILALIDILADKGGIVGSLIVSPLISFFDFYITLLILVAFVVISILITLNAELRLDKLTPWALFKKKEESPEDEYGTYDSLDEDEEGEDEEEEEDDEEYEDEEDEEDDRDAEGSFVTAMGPPSGEEYTPPPLSLLERDRGKPGVGDIKANANIIKRTMQNFGINVEMDEVSIGPTVTRYAFKPAEGVRLSKIVGLQNNLELALAAHPVRVEAPIPGKSLVGIEVPNSTKSTVGLATLIGSPDYQESVKPLLMTLGRDISGLGRFADVGKMPHLLIAGATGAGKSVMIHSLITSLLYRNSPENLRLVMIDPKRVELTLYNNIPHLLTPVITDAKKSILALKWAAREMDRRYDVLETESVRDIESYHKNILAPAIKKLGKKKHRDGGDKELPETMPYILIVFDELADIMQTYPRELEAVIVRLAQMSRAVGIHLVLSTQRPSVNVITGLIKANIPTRIALQVSSQIDSRTILDTGGAEKLLGAGDMLYVSSDMAKPRRIQSPFISEVEVKKVVTFLKKNYKGDMVESLDLTEENNTSLFSGGEDKNEDGDELYEEARETVLHAGKASTSYLQRKLRIGYARAARLMDMLEERGVIGEADGSRPREVLEGIENEEENAENEKES